MVISAAAVTVWKSISKVKSSTLSSSFVKYHNQFQWYYSSAEAFPVRIARYWYFFFYFQIPAFGNVVSN